MMVLSLQNPMVSHPITSLPIKATRSRLEILLPTTTVLKNPVNFKEDPQLPTAINLLVLIVNVRETFKCPIYLLGAFSELFNGLNLFLNG